MAEQEKDRLTIREIAEELGVSMTTVSRALSGKGRISQETRRKVLNYVGRSEQAGPAAGWTGTGNLILVLPLRFAGSDLPFLRRCMEGVCRMAAQRGVDVLLCYGDETGTEQLERQLKAHKADGVILTRTVQKDPCLDLLRRYEIPFVALGRLERDSGLQIDYDHGAAGREMTGLLLRLGLRRIAYLGGSSRCLANLDRLEGYRRGLEEFGLEVQGKLIRTGVETREQVADALDRILDQGPDCLLCGDDSLTVSVFRELHLREISVPRQLKVASLCDSELLENMVPTVSAVCFDASALGAAGCRMLLDYLDGREADSRRLPGWQMILRESTRVQESR